ncbi:MHO_1580 family protein [Mycoplasma testudineum]|uniref:MHO_1580 family protein n=1 Tax=Mycoplasma testudineum TaxID=244584 RepID=UPI000B9400F8|nr:hypothetical protein [Mycoplasma testudineum]OYD27097.1 hypothetical protein CG473_00425 [Mycoplasma testudineum]
MLNYSVKNINNTDVSRDINIKSGKVTFAQAEGFAKMRTGVNLEINHKDASGNFFINSQSIYDFEKGITKIGLESGSKNGLLIPFNFKGKYIIKFEAMFNEAFKDIEFGIVQNFKSKLLDPNEGTIRLKIKETNRDDSLKWKRGYISYKDFNEIIDNEVTIDFLNLKYYYREPNVQD